jgi:hypothetical protein
MHDRPLCKCHNEPMTRNGRRNGHDRWRCGVKDRARGNDERRRTTKKARQRMRYLNDPLYAERKREANRAYKRTAPGVLSEMLHSMSRVRY